jgi:uncharacterized membrane protein
MQNNQRNSIFKSLDMTSEDLKHLMHLRERKPARSATLPRISKGDRFSDAVTNTVGSWKFITVQSCLLMLWIILNVTAWANHWDPYPFILLNLALSFQAAYATPFILMSQNRQSIVDRQKAQQDLDCDLKAEMEIELLHVKLDSLRDREIAELNRMLSQQHETIQRLEEMLGREIKANHPLPSTLFNRADPDSV